MFFRIYLSQTLTLSSFGNHLQLCWILWMRHAKATATAESFEIPCGWMSFHQCAGYFSFICLSITSSATVRFNFVKFHGGTCVVNKNVLVCLDITPEYFFTVLTAWFQSFVFLMHPYTCSEGEYTLTIE